MQIRARAILLFIGLLLGLIFCFMWNYKSSSDYQPDQNLRTLQIHSDLEVILNCLTYVGDREGHFEIPEEKRGFDLNSEWLFKKTTKYCGHIFSYSFFDYNQEIRKIVDDVGNPIIVVYFGDSSISNDSGFMDLSERYRAVAWAGVKDGVNRNGSRGIVFLGITRGGEFETKKKE